MKSRLEQEGSVAILNLYYRTFFVEINLLLHSVKLDFINPLTNFVGKFTIWKVRKLNPNYANNNKSAGRMVKNPH